jgi:hypothetical protein
VLLAVLVMVAVGVVLLVLTRDGDGNVRHGIGQIGLEGVIVQVDHPVGHCPWAVFNFTATLIGARGSGNITYRWEGPEGTAGERTTVTLNQGRPESQPRFSYDVRGQGATSGDVTLHLLAPADRPSAAVHFEYRCP